MKVISSPKSFSNNNFDLLRILAATQVLIYHAVNHLHLTKFPGFTIFSSLPGVSMFFAISGYLISASYERNGDLKNYFRNRFLRIYPALWFCIILTVITTTIVGGISFINKQAVVWFISQLVGGIYTPGFLKSYGIGSYNSSLWTIPVELQFYIVLPVVYFLVNYFFRKKSASNLPFYIVWGLFFALAIVLWTKFPTMYSETAGGTIKLLRYSFMPHFYLFLTGMMLQRLKAYQSPLIANKGLYWLIIYLLFVQFVPHSQLEMLVSLVLLAIFSISLAYTLPGLSKKLLKGNDISYGVYIYHGLILNVIVELKLFGDYKYLALLIVATFILAFASWKFIEEPILKRKKKTINVELKEVA